MAPRAPLSSSAARSRDAPLLPADFNEIVIATSRPEQVDASSIYFTGVSHRGVTINWKAPGLGEWAWPILGYDIQISGDSDFTGSGVSFSTCPNGEGGVSMGPCDSSPSSCLKTGTTKSSEPGCFLTAQAQNQQTSRTLPGLDSGAHMAHYGIHHGKMICSGFAVRGPRLP